jgi:Ca2+-binding EF-hand superfamily protein
MEYQVCNLSLSDNVVEIIFHVFDTNRDGNLTYDEFLRVLYKRERDIARPVEEGVPGLLSSLRNRSNDLSFSRFLS